MEALASANDPTMERIHSKARAARLPAKIQNEVVMFARIRNFSLATKTTALTIFALMLLAGATFFVSDNAVTSEAA